MEFVHDAFFSLDGLNPVEIRVWGFVCFCFLVKLPTIQLQPFEHNDCYLEIPYLALTSMGIACINKNCQRK